MVKEWWKNQSSEKQILYKKSATIAVLILVSWLAWALKSRSGTQTSVAVADESVEVIGSDKMFEEDFREEARKKQQEVGNTLKEHREDIAALRELLEKMNSSGNQEMQSAPVLMEADNGVPSYPQAPVTPYITDRDDAHPDDPAPVIPVEPVIKGAIRRVKGIDKTDDSGKKKSARKRFYLAPGFIKARLLEGIEVSATQNAEENPPALLFRVQKPAVLPNNVKADLKGCFVIANAYGKLNKERIDFRTVSLHCISHKDKTLIDTEIRGHVDDADGKMGLAARVVTRVGANIGRAFASGMIAGVGEGYADSISHGINTVSGTIVAEPLTDGQIAKSGISRGLSRGARLLEEYYLEIIRQTSPTMESGSGRDVTIVLTEGVWLELKDMHAPEGDES